MIDENFGVGSCSWRARRSKPACVAIACRHPPATWPCQCRGLFVTIHCAGDLRGCLGTLDGRRALGEGLVRLAADVSCEDPRFRPLSVDELAQVTIDLSILTPPELVADPGTIDGLAAMA